MLTREYSSSGMPVLVSGVLAFALFHAQQHPRIQGHAVAAVGAATVGGTVRHKCFHGGDVQRVGVGVLSRLGPRAIDIM